MMKPFLKICLLLLVLCLLAGCAAAPVETEPPETETEVTEPPTEDKGAVESVTRVVTERTLAELEEYPNLRNADLSGSTCYTAIIVYMQKHPEVAVTYTVDMGGAQVDNLTAEGSVPDSGAQFEMMLKNLVFLPNLQVLHLPGSSLSVEQITALQEAYPEKTITYTVGVLGREVSADVEELDLSELQPDQVDTVCPQLAHLQNLQRVELMGGSGSALSKQDVAKLVEQVPGVQFHYVFTFFGQTISTTDEKVHFKNLGLTEDDEPELRQALAIMSGCEAFILENCGLSNEKMAEIREDYTNTELVWRVWFGKDGRYSYLTNATTIDAVYNVMDSNVHDLRYIRGAKYIDMGHNDYLTDASWMADLPNLEIVILSGSAITDLSGIENCKKLEFLELANCMKLEDISPLAGCVSLKYLNICFTKVSSLMALDGLDMQLLFCKQTRVGAEEQKTFKEIHTDCIATFAGREPYAGPGWRYVDNGRTYTEIYKKVREVFGYDAKDAILRAQQQAQGNH